VADALDTLVSLVPQVKFSTVHAPGVPASSCAERGCATHTSDWRSAPGSPENHHGVRALPVATLREVLSTAYPTPALMMGVVLMREGAVWSHCPRIAKDALPWLRSQGFDLVTTCFIADVDTPDHKPWTPQQREEFDAFWNTAPAVQTCGVYDSPKGYRLLQPLVEPIPADEAEGRLWAWLNILVAQGAWPKALECKDWGHLMRVPTSRDGAKGWRRPTFVRTERMVAVEPPQALLRTSARRIARRAAPPVANVDAVVPLFVDRIPEGWDRVADVVGAAIASGVRADWRRCFLALAGALCERGCPFESIPAVVERAHRVDQSYDRWEEIASSRSELARTTVLRWLARRAQPDADIGVLGYRALRENYPVVADALDATTVDGAEARLLAQLAVPAPRPVPVADAVARIAGVLSTASTGVTLVAAPPGTGKTHAVAEHARSLPVAVEGKRVAPGSRVAVSTPTHKLARQTAAKLTPRSLHLFSPPSHVDETTGAPTCLYAEAARALAAGAQSVSREFCDGRDRSPCEVRDTCPARAGMEGDPRGNLVVGVHGLVRQLREYAGPSGLLVVDEPGEVLVTERFTLEHLAAARRLLEEFVSEYARAMAPALEALLAWVREVGDVEGALVPLPEAIRAAVSHVPAEMRSAALIDPETPEDLVGDAVLQAVACAIAPDARSKAPPLTWRAVSRARPNPGRAAELGLASRVLHLLRRGILARVPYAARIDDRSGDRAVTLTGPNDELLAALAHEGPVVILDANAALHRAAVAKAVGYDPPIVELSVADGAPVSRSILVCPGATRTSWLPRGVPDWDAILPALRAVVSWVRQRPQIRRLGILAPQVLEAALMHALQPENPTHIANWPKTRRSLDDARARLAPVLEPLAGLHVGSGHFFALEGLDFMADFDATVTLTDPRPNLGVERDKAEYLGLDIDGRLDELAAAELQQAHGRLRTIHRSRPGWQLHVGAVAPAGWAGLDVEILRMPRGRPRTEAGMSAEDFAGARERMGLTVREYARTLGLSHQTVMRWERGEGAVRPDVAAGVRALVGGGPETAVQITLIKGVSGPANVQWSAQGVSGPHDAQGVSGPLPPTRKDAPCRNDRLTLSPAPSASAPSAQATTTKAFAAATTLATAGTPRSAAPTAERSSPTSTASPVSPKTTGPETDDPPPSGGAPPPSRSARRLDLRVILGESPAHAPAPLARSEDRGKRR
jgi:hypothetical protein